MTVATMSNEDNFADDPQGGIRDRAKEAKKARERKKTIFTRSYNAFQNRVKGKMQGSQLKEAYDVIVRAYEALEKSHDDYEDLVEKATIDAEGDYLEESFQLYSEAQVTYFQLIEEEGFKAAKNKMIRGMQAFERSCVVLTELGSSK